MWRWWDVGSHGRRATRVGLPQTCAHTHLAVCTHVYPAKPYARLLPPLQEEFKPTVKNQSGFEYLPERPKADSFVKQKWGWRGIKPGAACSRAQQRG